MRAKFTLLERELVGVGTYRTTYETNLDVKTYPAVTMLLDKIDSGVRMELGIREEAARNDDAFCIALTVPRIYNLGTRVPSSDYMLVVTHRDSVTRVPESFRLDKIDI